MSETNGTNLGALYAALAKARKDFPPIERTRTVKVNTTGGGSYEFAYAPLDTIFAATIEPLAKNGLVLTQLLDGTDLVTKLGHDSGAELVSRVAVPQSERMQQLGSAITYMRRYSAQAMLGLAAEEDDDGNAHEGNTVAHREDRAPKSSPTGATKIASVEHKTGTSQKTGKPWQRWDVTFDDGRKGSTFDQKIAALAQRIHAAGLLVTPAIESPDGRNQNLMGLETDGEIPAGDGEPQFDYEGPKAAAGPGESDRAPLMKRVKALEIERHLTADEKKELGRTIIGAGFSLATAPIPNLVSFVEFLEQAEAVAAWRFAQAKGAA